MVFACIAFTIFSSICLNLSENKLSILSISPLNRSSASFWESRICPMMLWIKAVIFSMIAGNFQTRATSTPRAPNCWTIWRNGPISIV